jgi:hypothetical protein
MRVVAEIQFEVPIRLHSSRCAVREQIRFTRQERGFSITEACGNGLNSVQRRRTLGGWRLLQPRATPGVLHHWISIKSIASAHSTNGSLNHRIGFDTT